MKQVGIETGFHGTTVRKAVDELGIMPEKVGGQRGGWSYCITDEQVIQVTDHLQKTRRCPMAGKFRVLCPVCNEEGHTELRCPHSTRPTRCTYCKEEKPRNKFRSVKRTLPNGKKTDFLMTICLECDRIKSHGRYRSNVPNRLGYLFAAAKARARDSKIPFTISKKFLIDLYEKQNGCCFYSGIALELEPGRYSISVDKKDPTGGYTEDNVVLCCWVINNMKSNLDIDEFVHICQLITARGKDATA